MEKCLIEVRLETAENKYVKEMDLEKVLLKDIKGLAM
jgi:hypothetical protein